MYVKCLQRGPPNAGILLSVSWLANCPLPLPHAHAHSPWQKPKKSPTDPPKALKVPPTNIVRYTMEKVENPTLSTPHCKLAISFHLNKA